MRCVKDFSDQLNKLGAHAGFFFGDVNIAAAAGSGLGMTKNNNDTLFWDYFSCLVSAAAVLSTISIGALTLKKSLSITTESTSLINDTETPENPAPKAVPSITLYEKILYPLANMGTFVGPFNVARFNPDFLSFVRKDMITQSLFVTNAIAMSLVAILAQPIQQKTQSTSALLSAFIATCGKSGAWIGAIFAAFIMEFVVLEKDKMNATEVHVLTGAMAGLFMTDLVLLYAAIKQKGNVEKANAWIQSPLDSHATPSEKLLWWPSFVLDVLRALVSVVGNVFAVPNIISMSSAFNNATNGAIKKDVYASLGALSVIVGANNAAVVMRDRLSSCFARENLYPTLI